MNTATLYNVTFNIFPYQNLNDLQFELYSSTIDQEIENVNVILSDVEIAEDLSSMTIGIMTVQFTYVQGQYGYTFSDFLVAMRIEGTQYDDEFDFITFWDSDMLIFYVFPTQLNSTTIQYTATLYNVVLNFG